MRAEGPHGSLVTLAGRMIFDLPAQKDAFLAHGDWDFTLSFQGLPIEVSMQEAAGLSDADELVLFKKVVSGVLARKDAAVQLAADRFFDEFLKKWNQDGPISREEFLSRLKPASIAIEPDGRASLEFTDDYDMFWGHAVVVSFDSSANITALELAG